MSSAPRPVPADRVCAALPWLAVAFVSFLPFLRGSLAGNAFFFRDLSRQFFPLRGFALDGLRHGELRFWNPQLHEGAPVSLPPVSYLPDLLQLLRPDEAGMSLLLALHVPLGALGLLALARNLGAPTLAAAGGALVYSLGGFYLSTLNLYVYLQAAAWAPILVLALRVAAERRRGMVAAAATTAIAISTTGAEIVAQAILVGLALGLERKDLAQRVRRMVIALLLGIGLAAPTLAVVRAALGGSAREEGFPVPVVLAQALHPLTLLQTLIGNWHGDLANLANRWWGSNFFPLGFPYFLSLYMGAAALALALVGLGQEGKPYGRIAALGACGLVASLGARAGLEAVVSAFPLLRSFRFPSKAFFLVHLCLSLLVALGLGRLAAPRATTAWRTLGASALLLGGALTLAPALPLLAPSSSAWFLAGFLPPSYDWPSRLAVSEAILHDAAQGGLIAACIGLLALAQIRGAVSATRASAATIALVASDLLRTGAGLNPMVEPGFFRLSPEMESVAAGLRENGGRVFVCDPESGPEYFRARGLRGEHDVFTFATFMETLTPAFNVKAGVATALSRDLTMLVPTERVLAPEESGAAAIPAVLDRLRAAGVHSILCLEPLQDPRLRLVTTAAPLRIAPARIHLYALTSPLPLMDIGPLHGPASRSPVGRIISSEEGAGWLRLSLEANAPARLLIRQAWAPGWSARLDDQPVAIEQAEQRHLAVVTPPGSHTVRLRYQPPGLALACATSLASLGALVVLWRQARPAGGPG